jgi:hypothetical protein
LETTWRWGKPTREQLREIELCCNALGLRVDLSAIASAEQAGRIGWNLMMLMRRMRRDNGRLAVRDISAVCNERKKAWQ